MSDTFSFSKSLKRLEEIVEKLQDPDIDLEEGIKLLQEGTKLHKQASNYLQESQEQIEILLRDESEPEQK